MQEQTISDNTFHKVFIYSDTMQWDGHAECDLCEKLLKR
jgi:hypothetical protein